MARCEYKHEAFGDSSAHRGVGFKECWLEGEHVAAFKISDRLIKTFCIFHAPQDKYPGDKIWPISERGKEQSKLLRELLNEWNKENEGKEEKKSFVLPKIHCGDINLSGYVFSHTVRLTGATFTGDARFDDATFTGDAWFGDATFIGDATFFGDAWFSGAKFTGNAGFSGAKFTGNAGFINTTFTGKAWFENATFTGNAGFIEATFTGDAEFRDAKFTRKAGFSDATFSGTAEFINAKFTEYAMFDDTKFTGSTTFSKATFTDYAIFMNATFKNTLFFIGADFGLGCNLNGLNIPELNLTKIKTSYPFNITNCDIHKLKYTSHVGETICFNKVGAGLANKAASATFIFENEAGSPLSFLNMDLSKSYFLGADVSKTRFDSCHWIEPEGKEKYQKVLEHDAIIKEFDKAKNDQTLELLKLLRSLYRQLMKNLEDNREYATAGDFHYREMQLRQMIAEYESRSGESWMLWAYHGLADYGESYKKLGWGIIFSLIITVGLVFSFETIWNYNRYYFASAVPFVDRLTQIAKAVLFGIVPSGLQRAVDKTLVELTFVSQLLIFIETFFVVIVGSLFVMAVNRRFRR